ncbi:MAG: helix-turn-helix domain-containing protein [Nitrospirota bacterium]|nr:helix-turn-helix domain-containing protein [Nitrospirota bacterium]
MQLFKKKLLRPDEVASALGTSRWTIYRWVNEGHLQGTKIGKGSLRIFSESVEELVFKRGREFGEA